MNLFLEIKKGNRVALAKAITILESKLKKDQKEGNINEDELKKSMDEIQKITDKFIDEIDKLLKTKQEEIMKV